MSNPLPTWIERLLGLQPGPGEGTAWSLHHSWSWPPWVTLLLVVFAVAFVVAIYLRENRQSARWFRLLLACIRLSLVAIVLLMLAQFVLSLQRTGLPYLVVLLDDSLSMTVADRYPDTLRSAIDERLKQVGFERPSRWNLARWLLLGHDGQLLRDLQAGYKLRLYFLTGVRPSRSGNLGELVEEIKSSEPNGEATRLGSAVRTVLDDLRGTTPAAIVLLSDGINTDGPALVETAAYARRKGVPLFTVGLGDDRPIRDLKLTDLLVDDVVFVDDLTYFEAKLSGAAFEGRQVEVTLRRDGKPQVLARTKVTVGPDDRPQPVRIAYRPKEEGEFRFIMEVTPQEGELQADNNRLEKTVRVRKEKIRVLLVQAYPSYEFRFLRNMLARDATIELNTVLQDADLEYAEEDSTALRGFPMRREELFRYDVILLGDANPAALSPSMMQNLVEFVDQPGKGGALVAIAGPRYMPLAYRETPLARLLPVDVATARNTEPTKTDKEAILVQPTELGLSKPSLQLGDTPAENAAIWANLPPLYWLLEATPRPGAQVLAEASNRLAPDGRRWPVIALQYVGAGKVLFHASDETWRWRFRVGDVFFARYWIQTIRYLSRSKLADGARSAVLSTDRREYRRGEPVQLRVRFTDDRLAPAADDGVTVVLEQQGHSRRQLQLHRSSVSRGTFQGVLTNPAIGPYHAWMAVPSVEGRSPAADFVVVAPPGEFERIPMDAAELQTAAQRTKGAFYTIANADQLANDLPEGRQVPIESLPPRPLWNKWPLLAAFLALLLAEWLLRKLGGMV